MLNEHEHPQGENASPHPDSTRRVSPEDLSGGAPIGRVDRYALLEELGVGGFGAVYRALDEVAGIEVAVKALPSVVSRNPDELEKVRENFKLVAKLRHPNIANVLHLHSVAMVDPVAREVLGVSAGDHLMVMDYVRGKTITAWRREFPNEKIPVRKALRVCAQIADTLDYAHSQKIVHRDIKPANVIITPEGDVRILDFGLAAEIRSTISRISQGTGDTSGTPAYMAPEQWAGQRQGASADQYSLAVMFYEMVSGAVPFASAFASSSRLIMYHAVKTEVPEPLPELTRRQNRALRRALSKTARDRFPLGGDFISAMGGASHAPAAGMAAKPHRGWERDDVVERVEGSGLRSAIGVVLLTVTLALTAVVAMQQYQAYQRGKEEQARLAAERDKRGERVAELLAAGQAAFEAKRYTGALDAVGQLLELDPEHAEGEALREQITLAIGMAVVIPVRSETEVRWQRVQTFERGQGFGEAQDRGQALLEAAHMLFKAKEYNQALEKYQQLLAEAGRLEKLASARQAAVRENEAAEAARGRAEAANAERDAAELVAGAVQLSTSASEAFDKGEFADAEGLWIAACAEFAKAEASAKGTHAVRVERSAYTQEFAKNDQGILEEFGGAAWLDLKRVVDEAERLAGEGKWDEAARKWEEARDALPNVAKAASEARDRARAVGGAQDQDALHSARVAAALAKAAAAKADGDWEAVLRAATQALEDDPEQERAKALRNEAQDALTPRVVVIAVANNREIDGAEVSVDGLIQEQKTPAKLTLVRGQEYRIRVTASAVKGGRRYLPSDQVFRAVSGGEQELRIELREAFLFPDLVEEPGAEYALLGELADGSEKAHQRQRQQMAESGLPLAVRAKKAGLSFRLVPAGTFVVVDQTPDAAGGNPDDPVVAERVVIPEPLYVGVSEVSRGQWRHVTDGARPEAKTAEDDFPVVEVSWNECRDFCQRLCILEGVPDGTYRLMTEDEWEYACRAGTVGAFYSGDAEGDLDRAGWYRTNSTGTPHAVAQKLPNAWGLYDLHGNVWEWCHALPDNTDDRRVGRSPAVLRGGGWDAQAEACSAASRLVQPPEFRGTRAGFRVARTVDPSLFNR